MKWLQWKYLRWVAYLLLVTLLIQQQVEREQRNADSLEATRLHDARQTAARKRIEGLTAERQRDAEQIKRLRRELDQLRGRPGSPTR